MKLITKRTSATGKKLLAVQELCKKALDAQKKLAKKYKFKSWRKGFWCVAGRISSVMFEPATVVDKKVWKNVNGSKNEWMPKLNSPEGKVIQKEFDTLPKVSGEQLNTCINFDEPFNTIGVNWGHKTFIGIQLGDKWISVKKIPKDCTEVTSTKYYLLFKNERGDGND